MTLEKVLSPVEKFFSEKIKTHGASFKGLDYNSPEAQTLRFEQLIKICDSSQTFSLNDYGCGYGSLFDYLKAKNYACQYRGFDISEPMILHARELHKGLDGCDFFSEDCHLSIADYTIACGIFNLKLKTPEDVWMEYILNTLRKIADLSSKGFAFNMLTKYSDQNRMRSDLYYGDPCFFFDYCKTHFSKNVSLLHDYNLYDFTMLVRL